MTTKAKTSFWLDGGYDFESVVACPYHPEHNWVRIRVGDWVENCHDPDERLTLCVGCYVPRCGDSGKDIKDHPDRCLLWRHHRGKHDPA